MENKGVYIIRAFFNLQDLKKSGQGEMEEIYMACGPRAFLQIAGRALVVFKRTFFCMKEVGKRDNDKKEKKDAQVENLLLLIEHFDIFYPKKSEISTLTVGASQAFCAGVQRLLSFLT